MYKILKAKTENTCKAVVYCLVVLWLACLGTVAYAKEATADQHSTENSAENKNTTILILGDSLSAAYKLSEKQGWVHLLAEHFDKVGANVTMVNASVSGLTTTGGLQILAKSLEHHQPQIVVIELGANDGLQGKPIPFITGNLKKLIEQAQASGAEVLLLGVKLPPNRGKRYTEPFFAQYKTLADKYGTQFVPFFLEGVAGVPERMMDDGLHPAASGQPIVMHNVLPIIEAMLP